MLVLLDIDGVMVKALSWKSPELLSDGFPAFSITATQALMEIIHKTGASIVLTTSHKHNYSIKEWESIFQNRGINCLIDRIETDSRCMSRKDEILIWLDNNDEENFVIIDDDKSLNDLPSVLKDKLVSTKSMIGLTHNDAIEAIEILKSFTPIYA